MQQIPVSITFNTNVTKHYEIFADELESILEASVNRQYVVVTSFSYATLSDGSKSYMQPRTIDIINGAEMLNIQVPYHLQEKVKRYYEMAYIPTRAASRS